MNNKIIALVDCNSFYCSCERLFRPDLKNKPVGVLSNNDGCFVSRTNELKKLGIKMGVPYFQVKTICDKNKVAVFSANFTLYTNISDRVMNTLFDFTPSLEIYSVDEAFLDLTGLDEKRIVEYCQKIKETVERNTGIPVGIGIARTKVLAKIANRIAKTDTAYNGVCSLIDLKEQNQMLEKFPIEDVWGVGRQSSQKMKTIGIKTAKQFRDFKNELLVQKMFTKIGRMIQDELRGITCFPFNEINDRKKQIVSSRTFGTPIYEITLMKEAVANYVSLACEKLRKQNSVSQEISVHIGTNQYKEIPQYEKKMSKRLDASTCDTRKMIQASWEILDEIFIEGHEYKKALVCLSHIQDDNEQQLSLFGKNDTSKDIELMKTMDRVNLKDGHDTLKIAACGTDKNAWYMKQTQKSQRFVSGWTELLKIRI